MLDTFINVGDQVKIAIPKENRDWGYNPCPDGTIAEVTGFSEISYGRLQTFGLKPGVYTNKCWVDIKFTVDGVEKTLNISSCHLKPVDQEKYKAELKHYRESLSTEDSSRLLLREKEFLRDLPDTPFYEMDVVTCDRLPKDGNLVIVGIDYNWLNDGRNFYRVSSGLTDGWHTSVNEEELHLVEHGNVWKYYHQEPIQFETLKEEAEFFVRLGHSSEVRNPANGLFKWTLEEALEAIKIGLGHSIEVSNSMFSDKKRTDVLRFRNEELGKRVAAATLEGFNVNHKE